jgi:hypothetical protein
VSDFQNVRDGKPFPPIEALAPLTEPAKPAKKAPTKRPAKRAEPKNTAAKKAAASTTTTGESAAKPQGESA